MSVGDDLKDAFTDVGTAFTILRESGNITGESLIYEINRQVTKPFIREFFLEAEMNYDTAAVVGDIIEFADSRRFLVVNISAEQFENETIKNESVLYKCNVTDGRISRPSGEVDSQTYRTDYGWVQVENNVNALMTSAMYGNELVTDSELGEIGLENHEVYVSGDIDVEIMDRWEPVSGEYYQVNTIKKRRYTNITVLGVSEDTRTV